MQTEAVLDSDLHSVADFMQTNIAMGKLLVIADVLPRVARLLWSDFSAGAIQTLIADCD